MREDAVRVLTVGLPLLIREILEAACADDPSIELVRGSQRSDDVEHDVSTTGADCVVVALEDGRLPRACSELLSERARFAVLGIGAHDGQTLLYRLRPETTLLGEASPQEIARAIKRIGAPQQFEPVKHGRA